MGPLSPMDSGTRRHWGPVAPPTGDRGACRPPLGRQGPPLYIKPPPPFPPRLSPKIPPKIQKKKERVRRMEAVMPCRIAHL